MTIEEVEDQYHRIFREWYEDAAALGDAALEERMVSFFHHKITEAEDAGYRRGLEANEELLAEVSCLLTFFQVEYAQKLSHRERTERVLAKLDAVLDARAAKGRDA